jgi:hypothetical protein
VARTGQDRVRLGGTDLPSPLTEQAKRKILGENLLRLHGMDVDAMRARLATV